MPASFDLNAALRDAHRREEQFPMDDRGDEFLFLSDMPDPETHSGLFSSTPQPAPVSRKRREAYQRDYKRNKRAEKRAASFNAPRCSDASRKSEVQPDHGLQVVPISSQRIAYQACYKGTGRKRAREEYEQDMSHDTEQFADTEPPRFLSEHTRRLHNSVRAADVVMATLDASELRYAQGGFKGVSDDGVKIPKKKSTQFTYVRDVMQFEVIRWDGMYVSTMHFRLQLP